MELEKIIDNVKNLLEHKPELRELENRKLCHLEYWRTYDNLGEFLYLVLKKKYQFLTNPETISRAIRKCQELYPHLRPKNPEENKEISKLFSNYFKK